MIPQFDEQYVDYGQNKLIWIFRLRLQDYRFRVLLHSFAVHVPHPSSMYDGYLRSMRTKGKLTEMDLYMKDFVTELKERGLTLKQLLPLCPEAEQSSVWKMITSD